MGPDADKLFAAAPNHGTFSAELPMKTILALSGVALLLAANSGVGQDVQVKQRAKELRDQNNVRQGVTPATPTSPPRAAPNGAAAPNLSPSLVQFQQGLFSIEAGNPVDAAQRKQLSQELLAAAQAAKPSLGSVNKLVGDLMAAIAEKPLPASSRGRFIVELDAILNPAKYPAAKPEGIFRDMQAIFQDNGLARNKAVAIAEGVKAISAEVQGGGAK
jgi:hypothetical protein